MRPLAPPMASADGTSRTAYPRSVTWPLNLSHKRSGASRSRTLGLGGAGGGSPDGGPEDASPRVGAVHRRAGPHLCATGAEAGTARPAIVAGIEAAGGEVPSSSEYRPSFDDIFATLVERHRAEIHAAEDGTAGLASATVDPGTAA